MAFRVLRINGDTSLLGKKWTEGFITRNPRVATCIGVPIDTKHIKCSQPEKMKPFFERHLNLLTEHHIPEEDIWNMDEHGMGLGLCSNSTVLAKAGKKTYLQTIS